MNTLERAQAKVREAAAPHPYDTRPRTAVLDEAEARELHEFIERIRRERSAALDHVFEYKTRERQERRDI